MFEEERKQLMRKYLVLGLILVAAATVLSGCGVPQAGVDVMTHPPEGWWQALVVWPLTKALIALNDFLAARDMPYSWGIAIILFTLFIKVVTFPLTLTQLRGMQAQKELQPKLQELQKKHGKNREKLSQEQMKLYQEAGVNPLSGCLPLLVTMPVLFGLYAALVALGSRLENAAFFWIPSLAYPAYSQGLSWIPEKFNQGDYGTLAAYLVLPILLMASQVVMQRMTTATTPTTSDSQSKMMSQMTTMMSLMFGFFTLQVPAGLSLYWVTSNLLQLAQQYAVTEFSFFTPKKQPPTQSSLGKPAKLVEVTPGENSNGDSRSDEVDEEPVAETATKPKTRQPRRRQRRRK